MEVVATSMLAGTIALAAHESAVNGFPKPLIPRMHYAFHSSFFCTQLQTKPHTRLLGPVSPLARILYMAKAACTLQRTNSLKVILYTVHVLHRMGQSLLTSATHIVLCTYIHLRKMGLTAVHVLHAAAKASIFRLCACKPTFSYRRCTYLLMHDHVQSQNHPTHRLRAPLACHGTPHRRDHCSA